MAAYATQADFAQLGLPAKATTGIAYADIDAALEVASRQVDSYIGSRYDLPLVSFDMSVTIAVCSIAAYNLLSRRGFAAGAADAEIVRQRYEDALGWCKDVARGLALPGVTTTTDQTKPPVNPQLAPFSIQSSVDPSDGSFVVGAPTPRGW
jgi:phage gp36-like protein